MKEGIVRKKTLFVFFVSIVLIMVSGAAYLWLNKRPPFSANYPEFSEKSSSPQKFQKFPEQRLAQTMDSEVSNLVHPTDLISALGKAILSQDTSTAMIIVKELISMRDNAVPALISTIRYADREIREYIARILCEIGNPDGVATVLDLAKKTEDIRERDSYRDSLKRVNRAESADVFIDQLGLGGNRDIVSISQDVLGRICDEHCLSKLVPLLEKALNSKGSQNSDPQAVVRARDAAQVFMKFDRENLIAPLSKLLFENNSSLVQLSAATGLATIGSGEAIQGLMRAAEEFPKGSAQRTSAISSVAEVRSNRGFPMLQDLALNYRDDEVRAAAIRALGNLDKQLVGPVLQECIKQDLPITVRKAVEETQQKLGPGASYPIRK